MAQIRLNNASRNDIRWRLTQHAFAARMEALKKEEAALFSRVMNDVHGENVLARIAVLPADWFDRCTVIKVNAGGWTVQIHADEKSNGLCIPASANNVYPPWPLKSTRLIEEVRAFAQASETLKKEREKLNAGLANLLAECKTLAAFYAAAPGAEDIIGSLAATALPRPTALAVTGEKIMQDIFAARGDATAKQPLDNGASGRVVSPRAEPKKR